jgi:hypothetical protein
MIKHFLHGLTAGLLFIVGGNAEPLPPMLNLPGTGEDPTLIDFDTLPVLKGEHALVTLGEAPWLFRLHNYLAFFEGKYWCLWSHGPKVEDHPTQHLRYATSDDGLRWSEPRQIVGPSPKAGFRYIARGLWVRDGKLLALAAHDEAYDAKGKVHFFGPSLQLLVFEWKPATQTWEELGVAYDDAINNFPPQKLATGEWAMMRRDHRNNVSMLIGGVDSPLKWEAREVFTKNNAATKFRPDEPEWWLLPDGRSLGIIRDNGRSMRLFRALSTDHGRTWTTPELTNFPDATSKFFGLRTSRGYYVLVSSANPARRNPLCLSTSEDGITFTRISRLPIPERLPGTEIPTDKRYDSTQYESFQYPHVIEHDRHLLIAFSRKKQAIEVVKVSLDEVDRLRHGDLR